MRCFISSAIALSLVAGCGGSSHSSTTIDPRPVLRRLVQVSDVTSAIREVVADGHEPSLGPLTLDERTQLSAVYGPNLPLWVDAAGRPNGDARDALVLLVHAADEGLDPVDYSVPVLEQLAAALTVTDQPTAQMVAAFDAGLSANTLRYLRHVHKGRIDPRAIGFHLDVPAGEDDFTSLLSAALAGHRIAESAAALAPSLVGYRDLRRSLARYRSLAADESLESLPPIGATVHPGESYAALGPLYRLLVAFEDMPADVPDVAERRIYDGAFVEGVKHFQMRHGLQPDGVLGAGTQAALRVPISQRVRQIELALERLRWLPDLNRGAFLAVDIPMFRLWGWDSTASTAIPDVGMATIVGRAINGRTPVFAAEMRYLIFRPYWDVPMSILRHEILPALDRDPGYLERQNMEIVAGSGDNAEPVALTAESLAGLRRGTLRVRQRPGPKNSLGLVKFVFPNVNNVYLHGTPAVQLFSRPRRDLSHGCVRVEDPIALAAWVLEDQPEWTRDRILAAMNAERPSRVNLTRPIHVILFYMTAAVMPEDGTIHFAEDIYGHDAALDRALASQRIVE